MKKRIPVLCAATFALCAFTVALPLSAADPYVEADAQTYAGSVGTNYGTLATMSVGAPASPATALARQSFMRFDLQSALPPGIPSSAVEKATLKLWALASSNAVFPMVVNVDVIDPDVSWAETTIKDNLKPGVISDANSYAHVEAPVTAESAFFAVDMTSQVRFAVKDNKPSIGFRVAKRDSPNAANVFIDFATKETTAPNQRPQLEIVLKNGMVWLGEWDDSPIYETNDVVSYNGSSYIALQDHDEETGPQQPDISPAYWGLLALKGDSGTPGGQGPMGLTGETGATGATGATGTQGPPGAQGATGSQGPAGPAGAAPDTARTLPRGDISMGQFTNGPPPPQP